MEAAGCTGQSCWNLVQQPVVPEPSSTGRFPSSGCRSYPRISSLVVVSAPISRVVGGRDLDVIGQSAKAVVTTGAPRPRPRRGRLDDRRKRRRHRCVPTTTVTLEMPLLGTGSLTVPVKVGVLLFVISVSTVTTGFTVSTINSIGRGVAGAVPGIVGGRGLDVVCPSPNAVGTATLQVVPVTVAVTICAADDQPSRWKSRCSARIAHRPGQGGRVVVRHFRLHRYRRALSYPRSTHVVVSLPMFPACHWSLPGRCRSRRFRARTAPRSTFVAADRLPARVLARLPSVPTTVIAGHPALGVGSLTLPVNVGVWLLVDQRVDGHGRSRVSTVNSIAWWYLVAVPGVVGGRGLVRYTCRRPRPWDQVPSRCHFGHVERPRGRTPAPFCVRPPTVTCTPVMPLLGAGSLTVPDKIGLELLLTAASPSPTGDSVSTISPLLAREPVAAGRRDGVGAIVEVRERRGPFVPLTLAATLLCT